MKKIKVIEYAPAHESHGYRNARWVENVSLGLRLVGFADEIAREAGYRSRIDHQGWFTDDDQREVFRGVVYLLPSRGGPQYVYGYADPNNSDCAVLCFDPKSDKLEAARAADRFAEIHAEHERDYQEAWRAGRRVEEIADEIVTTRREALEIAAEMREARHANVAAPTICGVLRDKIKSLYHRIQKMRKERADLTDAFGRRPGFVE